MCLEYIDVEFKNRENCNYSHFRSQNRFILHLWTNAFRSACIAANCLFKSILSSCCLNPVCFVEFHESAVLTDMRYRRDMIKVRLLFCKTLNVRTAPGVSRSTVSDSIVPRCTTDTQQSWLGGWQMHVNRVEQQWAKSELDTELEMPECRRARPACCSAGRVGKSAATWRRVNGTVMLGRVTS